MSKMCVILAVIDIDREEPGATQYWAPANYVVRKLELQ